MRGFFIFEGTPSFLKKYQKGTPSLLIAVPQPQVILERLKIHQSVDLLFIGCYGATVGTGVGVALGSASGVGVGVTSGVGVGSTVGSGVDSGVGSGVGIA